MPFPISNIYIGFKGEIAFTRENNKDIFVQMRDKKNEWLNLKNWVVNAQRTF